MVIGTNSIHQQRRQILSDNKWIPQSAVLGLRLEDSFSRPSHGSYSGVRTLSL